MHAKYFLDTNILVYSFSKKDTFKRKKVIAFLDDALKENGGCIKFSGDSGIYKCSFKKV